MIFNKDALLEAWRVSGRQNNPKTNAAVTSANIEEGRLVVEEDLGEMPKELAGGRRRRRTRKPKRARRKTRKGKNIR